MNPDIDLKAILIANGLGLILSVLLLIGNFWRKDSQSREDRIIVGMIFICVITSIIDPLSFVLDGVSGTFVRICLIICTIWTFSANLMVGTLWILLVSDRLKQKLTKIHRILIRCICLIGAVLLIINLFTPIVFRYDEDNVYQREGLYFIFLLIEFIFVADGVVIYIVARSRGNRPAYFPMFQFLMPLVVGITVQMFVYGISTIWPSFAVSVAGMVICLQNANVFRDGLTGLYNKSYLDNLKNKMSNQSSGEYIVMMLDMNNFKSINDNYGHSEGDHALVIVSDILSNVIANDGTVIRYAGDEFVIIMNTIDGSIAKRKLDAITAALGEYNRTSEKPYTLSLAIGQTSMNLSTQSIDDILHDVDTKMYDDKKAFYDAHREFDRRKR